MGVLLAATTTTLDILAGPQGLKTTSLFNYNHTEHLYYLYNLCLTIIILNTYIIYTICKHTRNMSVYNN